MPGETLTHQPTPEELASFEQLEDVELDGLEIGDPNYQPEQVSRHDAYPSRAEVQNARAEVHAAHAKALTSEQRQVKLADAIHDETVKARRKMYDNESVQSNALLDSINWLSKKTKRIPGMRSISKVVQGSRKTVQRFKPQRTERHFITTKGEDLAHPVNASRRRAREAKYTRQIEKGVKAATPEATDEDIKFALRGNKQKSMSLQGRMKAWRTKRGTTRFAANRANRAASKKMAERLDESGTIPLDHKGRRIDPREIEPDRHKYQRPSRHERPQPVNPTTLPVRPMFHPRQNAESTQLSGLFDLGPRPVESDEINTPPVEEIQIDPENLNQQQLEENQEVLVKK